MQRRLAGADIGLEEHERALAVEWLLRAAAALQATSADPKTPAAFCTRSDAILPRLEFAGIARQREDKLLLRTNSV